MYGETGNDEDGLDDMFGDMDDLFSAMFGGGGGKSGSGMGAMDDDFESFIDMLAQDDYTSFSKMFGGLGKNYRMGGKGPRKNTRAQHAKAAKGGKRGKGGADDDDMMEEMMMAMMMGEMMGGFDEMDSGFGFSMPPGFGGK